MNDVPSGIPSDGMANDMEHVYRTRIADVNKGLASLYAEAASVMEASDEQEGYDGTEAAGILEDVIIPSA